MWTKEQKREYQKNWYKKMCENPIFRKRRREIMRKFKNSPKGILKNRFDGKLRRALHKGATGKHTLNQWEELKKYFNYCCASCGRKEPLCISCNTLKNNN